MYSMRNILSAENYIQKEINASPECFDPIYKGSPQGEHHSECQTILKGCYSHNQIKDLISLPSAATIYSMIGLQIQVQKIDALAPATNYKHIANVSQNHNSKTQREKTVISPEIAT